MKIELFFNGFLDDFSLENIKNEDIIRIEKKLILESKLNTEISRNDIDSFLSILKEYPIELNYLIHESNLVGFLNKQPIATTVATIFKSEEAAYRFAEFISKFLVSNFSDSFAHYLKNEHYKVPYVLSYYNEVLPLELLEVINEKLINKLENAKRIFKSNFVSSKLENEIKYLNNTDFIDIFNYYPSHEIDELINDLITISADEINENKNKKRHKFYLKFYKALYSYDCMDESLNDTIYKNYLYADEKIKNSSWFSGNQSNNWWMGILLWIIFKIIIVKGCD